MKHWILAVVFIYGLLTVLPATAVEIVQQDTAFLITGKTYIAVVDGQGNMRSLKINEVEFLDSTAPNKGGAFPGKEPATSVNLRGKMIAARNDAVRVEYSFDDTGINILTEGNTVIFILSDAVNAGITKDGKTYDSITSGGDVQKLIAGNAAFGINLAFHKIFDPPKTQRLLPSGLCRGETAAQLRQYRFECGLSTDPIELLTAFTLKPAGKSEYLVADYPLGAAPVFNVSLKNLGTVPQTITLQYTLKDHWVDGKTLLDQQISLTIDGGKVVEQPVQCLALQQPGVYWIYIELQKDGKTLQRGNLGFMVDSTHYKPPLTRPADFRRFWSQQITTLRAIPFDAKLTEVPEKSTAEVISYTLEMTMADGKRAQGVLQAPRKQGKYCGRIDTPDVKDANSVYVTTPLPEVGTFTRWVSKEDNNMRDCYLWALRLTDYLRSRADVSTIYLRGASRTGPVQFVNAALDPTKISAVDIHVSTSCGISWQDKVYQGWGMRPREMAPEKWYVMSAYYDPVNFAPDMKAPFINAGGISDDLAPVPGILALYNWAEQSPWKRTVIECGGHQFFPSFGQLQQDLAAYLNTPAVLGTDDKIMKEH